MNILIIEDDKSYGARLSSFLSKNNFTSKHIENLQSLNFIDNINNFKFAIIDLKLKEESGLDAVSYILNRNKDCHIVILSGFGTINSAVTAIKMGAKHFLTKPASGNDILKALNQEENNINQNQVTTTLAEKEKEFILTTLEQNEGNISKTAKELGLHRRSLQRKLNKLVS